MYTNNQADSNRLARKFCVIAPTALLAMLASTASAQRVRSRAISAPAGFVSIPFNGSDQQGNQWMIYQNGMLQQRGNMQVLSQGAMLLVNGENVQSQNNNRATKDDKTGEVIFDGINANGVSITRRILIRADPGYVRYIDVFKNTQPQAQTLDVQLQTRVNFGVTTSQPVLDPGGGDKAIGWVAQTQANRAVVIMTAGRNSKAPFTVTPQPDSNMEQSDLSLTIPANAEVALMTLYTTMASADAGTTFISTLKDNDLLKDCSIEVRREIVNFNTTEQFIGDHELLRGTTSDVVELRGGGGNAISNNPSDQLRGTLKEPSYTLHTFYGEVTLPADEIVGMISVGQYRPRQLLVTNDGQIFGGNLVKNTVALELSSGQITQVPLAQISRLGYRKRADESDNPEAPKLGARPTVLLRSGDRIAIDMPEGPLDFLSRYGPLQLPVSAVSSVVFQSDDNSVHTLNLNDGSHLSGLLQMQDLRVTLAGTSAPARDTTQPNAAQPSPTQLDATQPNSADSPVAAASSTPQRVTIPIAAVARLQLTPAPADPDDQTPILQLSNGDALVGMITGELKIDTAFDTLMVNGSEIYTLHHARDAGSDIQIAMWDQTRVSGSVDAVQVPCKLTSGTVISTPIALIDSYTQPQPQVSTSMMQQIDSTVKDLSADDWKTREKAQSQLLSMGAMILPHLRQVAAAQPPEAQQRIEIIVKKLSNKKGTAAGTPESPKDVMIAPD